MALPHTTPGISRGPLLTLGCGQSESSPFSLWNKSEHVCISFFQMDLSGQNRIIYLNESFGWSIFLFKDKYRAKVNLVNKNISLLEAMQMLQSFTHIWMYLFYLNSCIIPVLLIPAVGDAPCPMALILYQGEAVQFLLLCCWHLGGTWLGTVSWENSFWKADTKFCQFLCFAKAAEVDVCFDMGTL